MNHSQTLASSTTPPPLIYQKPLFIHNSFLTSSITDPKSGSIILPSQSMMSERTRKHYSDNLYAVIDDGLASRKRLSRNTMGVCNPILESLAGMQKMMITKQALRSYKDKRMKKEVKFHLESVDENLDVADPFQSPGFSLNVENPSVIEFRMDHLTGVDIDESIIVNNFSKIDEKLELKFNNKGYKINLTEGEVTKTVGSVNLIEHDYHVFDANGHRIFHIERRVSPQGQDQLVAVKRAEEGDVDIAKADIGPWRRLTIETEVFYGSFASAKEKLMILGAVLVVMMKMSTKSDVTRSEGGRDACSVGGLWKGWMRKMRSIF